MARHRKSVASGRKKAVVALASTGAAALTLGFSGTALAATSPGSDTGAAAGTVGNGISGVSDVGSFGEVTDIGNLSGLVSGFVRALTTTPYFPGESGESSGGLVGEG
jgi:pyocin large subunit-like protein